MNDLKKAGCLWTTREHEDRSVDYILISEPKETPKLAPKPVMYVWGKNSGRRVEIEEYKQERMI
jgi:hypothetical protein